MSVKDIPFLASPHRNTFRMSSLTTHEYQIATSTEQTPNMAPLLATQRSQRKKG
jgi:hypothetical protein